MSGGEKEKSQRKWRMPLERSWAWKASAEKGVSCKVIARRSRRWVVVVRAVARARLEGLRDKG